MENMTGKKIGILGIGEENIALVSYMQKQGAKITICDKTSAGELEKRFPEIKDLPVELRLGPDYLDNLGDFEVIFRTPGLPYLNSKIQEAKTAGVEVTSQTKLFFALCPCPIIGVTGTKGKGTTATLISEILKKSLELSVGNLEKSQFSDLRPKIYLAGNIGTPPIGFIDKLKENDIVILELSSFQLEDLEKSPHIAVVLDIKIDHLDHHQDETEYVNAKQNIVKHQSADDFAVINADYPKSLEFEKLTPAKIYHFSRQKEVNLGAFVKNNEFILRADGKDQVICKTDEVLLKGEHNFENICAAITAAHLAQAEIESIQDAVRIFKGLQHRLEFVRELKGVKFYNDSFSTTPDTTIAAINSFKNNSIVLLIGGSEKNANYSELGEVINKSSIKAVIGIGLTAERIIKSIGDTKIEIIKDISTMDEAVGKAQQIANSGDVVILSPASASFDRFKNYKERGELFSKAVLELNE